MKKIPVTQETQTESKDEEREREICSGWNPLTLLRTLGSSSGKSIAFPRNDSSKGIVTGLKGPSRVVFICPSTIKNPKKQIISIKKIEFFRPIKSKRIKRIKFYQIPRWENRFI